MGGNQKVFKHITVISDKRSENVMDRASWNKSKVLFFLRKVIGIKSRERERNGDNLV